MSRATEQHPADAEHLRHTGQPKLLIGLQTFYAVSSQTPTQSEWSRLSVQVPFSCILCKSKTDVKIQAQNKRKNPIATWTQNAEHEAKLPNNQQPKRYLVQTTLSQEHSSPNKFKTLPNRKALFYHTQNDVSSELLVWLVHLPFRVLWTPRAAFSQKHGKVNIVAKSTCQNTVKIRTCKRRRNKHSNWCHFTPNASPVLNTPPNKSKVLWSAMIQPPCTTK